MKMNRINGLSGIVINLCYLNKSHQRAAITPVSDKYWFMLWIPPFALSPYPLSHSLSELELDGAVHSTVLREAEY